MDLLRWCFFIPMAALALYLIAGNWWIVVVSMRGRYVGSAVPIFGGLLGFFALRTAPFPGSNQIAPLALFMDPACAPGLVWALVLTIREAGKPRHPPMPGPIAPGAVPVKWDFAKHNTYFISDELWSHLPRLLQGIGWRCELSNRQATTWEQAESVFECLTIGTSSLHEIQLSTMSTKSVLERSWLPYLPEREEVITRYVSMMMPLQEAARREALLDDLRTIERILVASGALMRLGAFTTSEFYRCGVEKLEDLAASLVQERDWVSTHRWRSLHRRASQDTRHYTLPSGLLVDRTALGPDEGDTGPNDGVWFEWGICHTPGEQAESGYVALAVSADFSPDLQQRESALQDVVQQWLERQGCIAVSFAF